MLRDDDFVIDDENFDATCRNQKIDGLPVQYTLIPRDYNAHPVGSYNKGPGMRAVTDVPLIPMEEWPERIKELAATKSQISDFRNVSGPNGGPIPSLDQNGYGYCWFHSPTSAAMLLRAIAGLPYVRLSAFAGACIIKNFADQGGWGAAGLDFFVNGLTKNGRKYLGVPSVQFWPEKSTNRALANDDAVWQDALNHVITEGFIDLDAAAYDRKLSIQQQGSCLLHKIPTVLDFNHWSHSVAGMDLVDVDPGLSARDPMRYGQRIWNSWKDSWGANGTGVLTRNKAWADGATAPRAIKVSMA